VLARTSSSFERNCAISIAMPIAYCTFMIYSSLTVSWIYFVLSGFRNEEHNFRESNCPRSGNLSAENLNILYIIDPVRRNYCKEYSLDEHTGWRLSYLILSWIFKCGYWKKLNDLSRFCYFIVVILTSNILISRNLNYTN